MKKILTVFLVICLIACFVIFYPKQETKYLRVHIKANSNLMQDTNIEYKVKDLVCNYLTPLFLDCNEIDKAINILNNNLHNIQLTVNSFLKEEGKSYACTISLNNEYFPTRVYDGIILEDGYYEALNICLGEGKGDNWWCVLYPPMCLQKNTKNIEYKSRLLKIINQIFG